MNTADTLRQILKRINGKGYKAYKQLKGSYQFETFTLFVDHVQGDPFAAPTKIRLRVTKQQAGFPEELFASPERQLGTADALIRIVAENIRRFARLHRGTGKSGLITIDVGGQEILPRTAFKISQTFIEARLEIGLPARGRTILGPQAEEMFFTELPQIVQHSLFYDKIDSQKVRTFAEYTENYFVLQRQLKQKGLVAFIADQSILPRASGISQKPLPAQQAVPFRAPQTLRIQLQLKNPLNGQSEISGCGIPQGITLIVGGGFHGKSTLLKALETGIYPHIPGDGREFVVTNPQAVKIRAEDGRRVEKVDIRPFINHLPGNKDAAQFSTEDASGSTSQAANIIEALEAGAEVLLLDEDTSATNFMIRDARMQALVHKQFEPITPFIDRVRELYERFGVSTVLVMGGSGDYFSVADTVIMMKEYVPLVVTEQARKIAQSTANPRQIEREFAWHSVTERCPFGKSFNPSKGKKEVKIEAKGLHNIQFGSQTIDLQQVEQLADLSQTRAIGYALHLMSQRWMDGQHTIKEVLQLLHSFLAEHGLEALTPFRRGEEHPGRLALPRLLEVAAALNRFRSLIVRQKQ